MPCTQDFYVFRLASWANCEFPSSDKRPQLWVMEASSEWLLCRFNLGQQIDWLPPKGHGWPFCMSGFLRLNMFSFFFPFYLADTFSLCLWDAWKGSACTCVQQMWHTLISLPRALTWMISKPRKNHVDSLVGAYEITAVLTMCDWACVYRVEFALRKPHFSLCSFMSPTKMDLWRNEL